MTVKTPSVLPECIFLVLSLVFVLLIDIRICQSLDIGPNDSEGSCSFTMSQNENEPEEMKSCGEGSTTSTITSLALVPYDEDIILPHEKRVRRFNLAGHQFEIWQDWQALGVAAVVWDAAVVLGEYLSSHSSLVSGRTILELGAGTGLTGMVAAALGGDVTMTERLESLDYLKTTVNFNTKETWHIKTSVLDWTQPIDRSLLGQFDLILGADIVYIEDTFPDLLRTLTDLTTVEKDGDHAAPSVLLSCRIRYDRDLHFFTMLEEFFTIEEVHFDQDRDVKIYIANRKS